MKGYLFACLSIVLASVLFACQPPAGDSGSHSQGPLVTGELLNVQIWEKEIASASSNTSADLKEGRVEIYDKFIIVTEPNGQSRLSLHGWYSKLMFKRD